MSLPEVSEFLADRNEIMQFLRQTQPEVLTAQMNVKDDCADAVLQKADQKSMTADFVIVTRKKRANLHNNKVQITPTEDGNGLVLDLHKRAPVVLFEHGQLPLPIGQSEQNGVHTIKLEEDRATARVVFSQSLPEAAIIFGLVVEKTLRMASIGFLPDKIRRLSEDEMRVQQSSKKNSDVLIVGSAGIDVVQSLLLEWSITATGADTGAFKQMLSRGNHHGEKLSDSLKQVFQKLAGPKTTWSPGWEPEPESEPTEKEILAAVEVLPDRVFQTIEKRSESFVDSLNSQIDKVIRKASGKVR